MPSYGFNFYDYILYMTVYFLGASESQKIVIHCSRLT